ncbi:MAG: hypothetical protein WA197_03085 [Candidatus Acidiferrales bacterium]
MADITQGDEILFHISPKMASRLNVMDLEILGSSASLASPAIALQNLLAQLPIGIPVQSKSRLFWD